MIFPKSQNIGESGQEHRIVTAKTREGFLYILIGKSLKIFTTLAGKCPKSKEAGKLLQMVGN